MVTQRTRMIGAEVFLVGCLLTVAAAARYAGRHEYTEDMRIFIAWHAMLRDAGGWGGFGTRVGNYNAPFLYLLQAASLMPGPMIVKIKLVWVLFDVLLAYFAYRIVALRGPGRRLPVVAALVVVLLPTVVVNASFWGQMDAMWASFALGGVYFLMRGSPWWGVSLCTVALALKPHGIFVFPLIMLLLLAGRLPWRTLLAVPAVYLALDLPALLMGRDPVELLTVYDPGRQAVRISKLTSDAPSVFAFLPVDARIDTLKTMGYGFSAALVLGICLVLVASRTDLTRPRVLHVATLFAILLPFTLPGMHERYFFLADVLTVVLAFLVPRLWPVPLLVQGASLLAYQPFLFGRDNPLVHPMIPATLMLAALILTAHALFRDIAPAPPHRVTTPQPAADPGNTTHEPAAEPGSTAHDAAGNTARGATGNIAREATAGEENVAVTEDQRREGGLPHAISRQGPEARS